MISGAKTTDYLLEKSRIVTHASDERNYHVFYELLKGLRPEEKEKYGLQTPDKYFYLNQACPDVGPDVGRRNMRSTASFARGNGNM